MTNIPRPNPGPFNLSHVKSTELRNLRVKLHGRIVTLYSIGYVAAVSKRAQRTLRKYERNWILPRPLIKTPSNIRFYLADEVYQYGTIIANCAPTKGKRADLDPTAKQALKEMLAQAKDRIRAKMSKDINLINAELKNETEVKDLSKVCLANRKLIRLFADVKRSNKAK